MKFYQCKHCGNIIAYVDAKGPQVSCCGDIMGELKPNTVDASKEKHVPVVTVEGQLVTVKVGSTPHPMTAEHSIKWIALETKMGNQRKELAVGGAPEATFMMCKGDSVVNVYAYCNLHGLWKA
ncbi:MAG: desulfoferrodoxin family protein [Sphaerochaetaceae bacterium]